MAVYNVLEDHGSAEPKDPGILTGTPVDVLDSVLDQLEQLPTAVLLCGPEIMMQKIAQQFTNRGLAAASIWLSIERRMHCAVGLCGHCYLQHEYACKDGPTYRWDQFQPLSPTMPAPTDAVALCK